MTTNTSLGPKKDILLFHQTTETTLNHIINIFLFTKPLTQIWAI